MSLVHDRFHLRCEHATLISSRRNCRIGRTDRQRSMAAVNGFFRSSVARRPHHCLSEVVIPIPNGRPTDRWEEPTYVFVGSFFP